MVTLEKGPELKLEEWAPPVRTGLWNWFMQRISAAVLVVFLLAHFWVLHYAVVGEQITFERVFERLQSPWFIALDSALLAVAIYHGLNGVRMVILDFGLGPVSQRIVAWVLFVVGVVTFVYGLNALLPFVTGRPIFPLG
jgi:succinate dehydrogenase cytochrome b556 subunit